MGWIPTGGGGGGGLGALVAFEHFPGSTSALASTAQVGTDDSRPQISEGAEAQSEVWTPDAADNIIVVEVFMGVLSRAVGGSNVYSIFEAGGVNAIGVSTKFINTSGTETGRVEARHVALDTSELTFSMRHGPNSGSTSRINANVSGAERFGASETLSMKISEYLPP